MNTIIELPVMGLCLPPMGGVDEWRETGERLASAHKAVNWLIGDWWNAGEPYGDRVAEAARIFPHLSQEQMRNYGSIAGKFEPARRRPDLGWAIHREVASLPPTQADHLLDQAAEHRWSRRDVEQQIIRNPGVTLPRWLPVRETPVFDRDEAKEAIFCRLSEAAQSGAMCPTADELVEISGVGSVSTTVAFMHILEDEGRIKVERYQRGRVVTITATGASTAAPSDTSPHWRQRPEELPTPTVQGITRDKPTVAADIFAKARAKGRSPQDYLADLVWLGWEVECARDSGRSGEGTRVAA